MPLGNTKRVVTFEKVKKPEPKEDKFAKRAILAAVAYILIGMCVANIHKKMYPHPAYSEDWDAAARARQTTVMAGCFWPAYLAWKIIDHLTPGEGSAWEEI